ncbi:uncharacterized protein FA14DRAFT_66367 [Meira miltonrushii]|uniref:SHSP domain-containing protein n=1 Tax=Meira miltonrushii TaxID=1280837 RepID=A0A316V9K0_9BASI|nr:uncharacterized protein FA14DRAFT_66367 [Meira miltonrushii]PWN33924.1 hypothetical protein FA14DRAFT_66367 [Meira miltonrushii]
MSVFFSTQPYHPFTGGHRHASQPSHGGRRCGSGMTLNVQSPFDPFSSRQHPFFSQLVEEEDEEEQQLAQYLRARYQQQLRQAELERERERRRIQQQQFERQRRQRAVALARAAWQEEQVRLHRLAVAEEQYRRRQQRAAAIQQQQRQQRQWQDIASHGLATALQFAEWFGGLGEEEESHSNNNQMEVDEKPQSEPVAAEEPEPQPTRVEVPIASNDDQDPPEEDISKSAPAAIFTLPLPSDASQRSSIKAEDIQVTFDEPTNTIQVRGLWNVNNAENEEETITLSSASSVTTNEDQEETRGRKRSRSPKRPRVSDVDETTGEEIVVEQEENTDGFVNVAAGKQAQGTARIPVPEGANVSKLRAELTDEGFKLFL